MVPSNLNLVDVHCHINHRDFYGQVDAVLRRAKEAGVKGIIVSGVNPIANRDVLRLAEKQLRVDVSLGLYPLDLLGISKGDTGLPRQIEPINLEAELEFISQNRNKIVAIGEIGLDYFWDKNRHEDQKENFRRILSFAKQLGKPVIIHSRKAEKDCLDILESEISGEIPVVLHCFSGGRDQVERAIQLGYYLSIPPNIVRQQQFQMVAELTPLTQILTETDSPWLSPFPDQKNEPAFVIETVKKIADIKRSTVERVAIQIWKNYEKVFYGARN